MRDLAYTLSPVMDVLIQAIGALLLAAAIAALERLWDWLGLAADDKRRAYLNEALERAIDWAEDQTRSRLPPVETDADADAGVQRDTSTAVVEFAAGYVRSRVPDALKRLGVTDTGLEAMIRARLARV